VPVDALDEPEDPELELVVFGVSPGQANVTLSVAAVGWQSSHLSKHATQSLKLPNVSVDFFSASHAL
jgi:hypothetical protein